MRQFVVFLVVILTYCVNAEVTPINVGNYTKVLQCKNQDSSVIIPKVQIYSGGEFCEKTPCNIQKGIDASLTMAFRAPYYLENMKPNMLVNALGKEIPYPFAGEICDGLIDTICPLVKNERATYQFKVPIPGFLSKMDVGLQFSIIDGDTNKMITCFSTDLLII